MKLIIKGYNSNSDIIFEGEFNAHQFYETIFCNASDNLGLTKMPIEYRRMTKEALELRKNRKITLEEKMNCYNHIKLDSDIKAVLDIALVNKKEFINDDANDIISKMKGLSLGNLEDINSFFEEVDSNNLYKLEFIKEE